MHSKKSSPNSVVYPVLGILALCVASVALAGESASSTIVAGYRFTSFDVPDAGPIGTIPHHINNAGVITGGYFDSNSVEHGFVRAKDGSLTSFQVAPGLFTDPEGINDGGDVVGFYFDANGGVHGFLRDRKGTITSLDVPFAGNQGMQAYAINNEGVITGRYFDASFTDHVFLRSPQGKFTAVNVPGDEMGGSISQSINEEGVIDGSLLDNNSVFHGFIRQKNGSLITFDAPEAGTGFGQGTLPAIVLVSDTENGLNERGDLTGAAVDSGLTAHGFLRKSDGEFVSFDVPGGGVGNYLGTWPGSINSSGVICGLFGDAFDSLNQAFVRYSDGSIVPFAAPGAPIQTSPFDINDSGEIAGLWEDASFTNHGFFMVPLGK